LRDGNEIKRMYIKPWPRSLEGLEHFADPYDSFLFNIIRSILKKNKTLTFIEVGFGSGRYLRYFSKRVPFVVGVEISARLAKIVKEHSSLSNIDYVVADAEHLPFRKESFELALTTETIEHLPNPEAALNEINQILKPNGEAILSVPCLGDMSPLWATLQNLALNPVKIGKYIGKFFGISPKEIEKSELEHSHKTQVQWKAIAKAAGFRVTVRGVMIFPIYVWGNPKRRLFKIWWVEKLTRLLDATIGRRFPFNFFGHGLLLIGQKVA